MNTITYTSGKQQPINSSYMSLSDVGKAIRSRESKITHFIGTLTGNQITLLYLLFQTGIPITASSNSAISTTTCLQEAMQ